MMNRNRRRGLDPMIAMINMVFILLAFFLLGEFKTPTPESIEIPISKSGEKMNSVQIITISKTGNITGLNPNSQNKINGEFQILADRNIKANEVIKTAQMIRNRGGNIIGIEVQK